MPRMGIAPSISSRGVSSRALASTGCQASRSIPSSAEEGSPSGVMGCCSTSNIGSEYATLNHLAQQGGKPRRQVSVAIPEEAVGGHRVISVLIEVATSTDPSA